MICLYGAGSHGSNSGKKWFSAINKKRQDQQEKCDENMFYLVDSTKMMAVVRATIKKYTM